MFRDDIVQVVLAIDSNPLLARGISMLLSEESWLEARSLSLPGDWSKPEGLKREHLPCLPNVVILDPSQFEMDVSTIVGRLNAIIGKPPLYIAYCEAPDDDLIENFFDVGFRGIISKHLNLEAVKVAVASVCHGFIHLEETFAREVLAKGREVGPPVSGRGGRSDPPQPILLEKDGGDLAERMKDRLTDREAFVVQSIALGKSMKEIARELDLSSKTIETYKARAANKLQLKSRSQIVDYAMRNGLV
ncbi:response regulator transcription factor [Thioclava sp. GXIMD4216]|uniref:Response regulator transcription factor n=1 Tax=Thioclava litoralis TaxID=3076557 RepID=A0ABZ1DZB2_9RHOB|nr:response regulator transcription factor [Thioclava sp. FTW29]